MKQVKVDTNIIPPMPVVLAGTVVKDKPNFMTVGWCTRVNYKPPMIAICIADIHYTTEGIKKNQSFSISIPSTKEVKIVDYCGIASGKKEDKSHLFELFYGEIETAPMISSFPVNLSCKLLQTIDLPTNKLFIGEIIEAYAMEEYIEKGKVNISKIDPFILTMPDNNYWKLGTHAGDAWEIGIGYK